MKISIRVVLMLLMCLLAVASCATIGLLIGQAGIESTREGADLLRDETVHRKKQEIASKFNEPLAAIHALQASSKVSGSFNVSDISVFHPWLCLFMRLSGKRFIYMGTEVGTFAAARASRQKPGICTIKMMDARYKQQLFAEYTFTPTGTPKIAKRPEEFGVATTDFDPRMRPWFNASINHTAWSSAYLNWNKRHAVTTVGTPFYNGVDDRAVGVFATDFSTRFLVRYLRRNVPAKSGKMILVDSTSQQVIGDSWGENTVVTEDDPECDLSKHAGAEDGSCKQLRLAKLGDMVQEPMLKQTLAAAGDDYLLSCNDVVDDSAARCKTTVGSGRDRILVDVIQITDPHGLDLRLVILIPESDFMSKVWSRSDLAAVVASCVVAVFIAVSLTVVYAVLYPLKTVEERLHQSGALHHVHDQETSLSMFTEVANIQEAHSWMSTQLLALRSYVPQQLLQAFDATGTITAYHATQLRDQPFSSFVEMSNAREFNSDSSNPLCMSTRSNWLSGGATTTTTYSQGEMLLNIERVHAAVNQYRTATATMMVMQLTTQTSPSNLHAFSAETAAFMDATIPHILHARGVIELQRPSQLVATFEYGMHAACAAECALRIAKSAKHARLHTVSVLHTGTFLAGACGSQGRNAFVISSEFFTQGFKIAELAQRSLLCSVLVTDATARSLPGTIQTTPVDRVCGLGRGCDGGVGGDNGCTTLFAIHRKGSHRQSEEQTRSIIQDVFTNMLNGNYVAACAIVETSPQHHPQLNRMQRVCRRLTQGTHQAGYCRSYVGWTHHEGDDGAGCEPDDNDKQWALSLNDAAFDCSVSEHHSTPLKSTAMAAPPHSKQDCYNLPQFHSNNGDEEEAEEHGALFELALQPAAS